MVFFAVAVGPLYINIDIVSASLFSFFAHAFVHCVEFDYLSCVLNATIRVRVAASLCQTISFSEKTFFHRFNLECYVLGIKARQGKITHNVP